MKTDHPLVIGIDLGTTNSTVAIVRDGALTIIPVHGQQTMPSAVGIDPTGKLLVGQAAKNQAISAPENTLLSIKRLMGTEEKVALGGKSYRPEEISALILGELKRAAEEHLGQPVSQAVITVPAFFNERQRLATQDAGQLAGLEVLRIINEPTAAALAYGAGQVESRQHETLLVYDLGGGTFDVSVVRVEDGVVEVRASHGDIHLGGDDFDEALAGVGEKRLAEKQSGTAEPLPAAARRRLKSAMENAKILLSDEPFAMVREEYLTPAAHLETEIARSDYEELIDPWLKKTLDCVQRALSDAGATADELDKVMLVGGATRTPYVQALLMSALGIEPRHEINPDLVVAMGAAIQGAALAGQPAPAILIDITAHTYSNIAQTDDVYHGYSLVCCPIIRRGTPLPVSKSELFFTNEPGQEKVQVIASQGESLDPDDNIELGRFMVEGLSRTAPSGNQIVVQFRIDLSGLLTVTATEKLTGLAKSVTIDTAGQHRLNLDAARTNLASLFAEQDRLHPPSEGTRPWYEPSEDPDDDEDEDDVLGAAGNFGDEADVIDVHEVVDAKKLLASAKSLRARAANLLAQDLPEADANAVQASLAEILRSIDARDYQSLRSTLDTLSDLLFYLEE